MAANSRGTASGASRPARPASPTGTPRSARPDAPRRGEGDRLVGKEKPTPRASGGAGAPRRPQKPVAARETHSPDTESVSAYAVGAPLNRNFGLLQTTTARVVVLALTLAICAVIVTPVLRNYFKQYNANNAIRTDIQQQQAINEELRNELARWEDDKYVIAQARERLTFVFPGETPYRVMGWDDADLEEVTGSATETPALFPDQDVPWYEDLWQSVQRTGALVQSDGESADDTVQDGTTGSSGDNDEEPDVADTNGSSN